MATVWEGYLLAAAAYLQNQQTVTLLSSTTLSTATASISFSSIPQIYNNLMIVLDVKSASTATGYTADNAVIQYNGISTSSYNACYFANSNGTVTAAFVNSAASSGVGQVWNSFSGNTPGAGGIFVMVPGYTSTTFRKGSISYSYASDSGGSGEQQVSGGFLSSTTAAVTSLTFTLGSASNFVAGSYIGLYGM